MSPFLEHHQPGLLPRWRSVHGHTAAGLPIRPRAIRDPGHAAAVLAGAAHDRRVLPRWGINSPIRDGVVHRDQLADRHAWVNRDHWITITIPLVYATHHDVMRRHHIELATLRRWAEAKSLYAQGGDPGRVIVRPATLAGLMACDERTVQRCNAAARAAGLEQLLVLGRMLSLEESTAARKAGSPQRGLASVVALCTPADLVDQAVDNLHRRSIHVTPTSGARPSASGAADPALKTATATVTTPSLRSDQHQRNWSPPLHGDPRLRQRPHQTPRTGSVTPEQPSGVRQRSPSTSAAASRRRRRDDPGYSIAVELVTQVPWLRHCPPGRIAAQLNRYARADLPAGYHWTGTRLLRAMDGVNTRLHYNSPTQPKTAPWGLLAWYLRQIDPIADSPAPDAGRLV